MVVVHMVAFVVPYIAAFAVMHIVVQMVVVDSLAYTQYVMIPRSNSFGRMVESFLVKVLVA